MTDRPSRWPQRLWRWLQGLRQPKPRRLKSFASVPPDFVRAIIASEVIIGRPPADFFESARFGFAQKVRDYLRRGADVNARDPRTQGTVLHHAASSGDLETLEAVLQVPGVDTLVQDHLGRLAYDLCTDPELGNRLLQVHQAQARERGVRLNALM